MLQSGDGQTAGTIIPLTLERTSHAESELRQQATWALNVVKIATQGELCSPIPRFSHS